MVFERVGAIAFEPEEEWLISAVIDPAAGFAYFGTYTSLGKVIKVQLSDFSRVGALTFEPGERWLKSATIDPAAGFAYFGTDTSPGVVIKIKIGEAAAALKRILGEGIFDSRLARRRL